MKYCNKYILNISILVLFLSLSYRVLDFSKYSLQNSAYDVYQSDSQIISARNMLLEIKKQDSQIRKLTQYCISIKKSTVSLGDMRDCKNEALNYLGYNKSHSRLIYAASLPLLSELKDIVLLEKGNNDD